MTLDVSCFVYVLVLQEKLLIAVSLSIGVISLAIPIYYKFTIPDE